MNSNMTSLGMQRQRDTLRSHGGQTMVSDYSCDYSSCLFLPCVSWWLCYHMTSVRFIALIQVGEFYLHTACLNPQGGATTCILTPHEQHLFSTVCVAQTHMLSIWIWIQDLDSGPDVLKSFTEKQIKKETLEHLCKFLVIYCIYLNEKNIQ